MSLKIKEYRLESDEIATFLMGCSNMVILDKVFGPLIFANLRIRANFDSCEWIIERERISDGEFIEVHRIPGQLREEFDNPE